MLIVLGFQNLFLVSTCFQFIVMFHTSNQKLLFSAVVQNFDATVSREDILLSNDVLFKCSIPSFVADFVTVDGWVDSEGSGYSAGQYELGKF